MPEHICIAGLTASHGCKSSTTTGRHVELFVPERSTSWIEATLIDMLGSPIAASDLDDIVLTIRELGTGDIVNGRDGQSVLNSNGGDLVDSTGTFTFQVTPDDTAIVNPDTPAGTLSVHDAVFNGSWEPHLATFTYRWMSDRQDHFSVLIGVLNQVGVSP